MIRAIVFDMGGVLVTGTIEKVLQNISKNIGVPSEVLNEVEKQHHKELITGKLTVSKFIELVFNKTKIKLEKEEALKIWEKSYLEVMNINEELITIIKGLKKKYKIGLISNLPDLHVEINKKRRLFAIFKPCLLSCEVGLAKPEEGIFKLVLKKLRLKAKECIFVDDREQHLKTAQQLGFETILYKNNELLLGELKKIKII